MKKLSVFALVAALLTAACGTIEYSDANVIDPTNTLYITLEFPAGAAESPDPDFNTSCRNPGDAIGGGANVATVLAELIEYAYDFDFGVIHLCAGTYVTEDIIEFPNLGSITIEGDGMDDTIISGTGDHALLAMIPAECAPADEPCPSYFNVLTLKDLTLADGVGDFNEFVIDGRGEDSGIQLSSGGAVTAPLLTTERVRFSNNSAPCGGAVALYGWTQLDTAKTPYELEDTAAAIEYLANLVAAHPSQFTDTKFTDNSAAMGGAIAGSIVDTDLSGDEVLLCFNTGPLTIVDSIFERNRATLSEGMTLPLGGGAISTGNIVAFEIALSEMEDYLDTQAVWNRNAWLTITGSTFSENEAANAGGALLSLGKTKISRTTFKNNRVYSVSESDGAGGAIAMAGDLLLSYSRFSGNSADSGGAIALNDLNGKESVLRRNSFTGNVAMYQGGAIAGLTIVSSAGLTNARSSGGNQFISNRAPIGSAIAVPAETCSRSSSRRMARDWAGNTFRHNRGGRLPVECYVAAPAPS